MDITQQQSTTMMNSSSFDAHDSNDFMIDTLTRHIFFERIFPLLPIESNLRTYQEVEANEFYTSCRSVVLNVAVSRNLNAIINHSLDLIDQILQNHRIISNQLGEESIQSILVLLRLLSDVTEYCWEIKENARPNNSTRPTYEDQKKFLSSNVVGFSTHRPNFHTIPPDPIDSNLATRFIKVCTVLKFNTGSLRVLQNMSYNLTGSTSIKLDNILPEYQAFLKENNYPLYAAKVDLTLDYIQRFIGATNPNELINFLKLKIITPFATNHSISATNIVEYLDLYGCIYLTNKRLPIFLEMVRKLSSNMRRTSIHSLLLYFASKAMMIWMLARPSEYVQYYSNINNNEDPSIRQIKQLSSSLFEDVYSNFNISALLSTVYDFTNSHSNTASNITGDPIIPTNTDNNNSYTGGDNTTTTTTTTTSGTANTASSRLLRSARANSNHSSGSYNGSPNTVKSIQLSLSNSQGSTGSTGQEKRFFSPVSPLYPSQNFPFSPIVSPLDFSDSSTKGQSTFNDENYSQRSRTKSASFVHDFDSHNLRYPGDLDEPSKQTSEYFNLDNVLDLFANFSQSDLLSHTAVLRFLVVLTLLDPDAFNEINSTSFKNIPDINDDNINIANPNDHNSSIISERAQGLRHLTHGLKKLTSLQTSKKCRPFKFLSILLRNINAVQVVSDVALIDSIRSLLTLVTMSSSVRLHNENLPIVLFSKRLFEFLGHNLDIGKNWNAIRNNYISNCLERYPKIKRRLQLEFFAGSIQLNPKVFLHHLQLDKELTILNLKRLSLYTEGFRIFFHLITANNLRGEIAISTSKFFKSLFCLIADILLKGYPYFDNKVTDIVTSILDGSILEKFETARSLSQLSRSADRDDERYTLSSIPESERNPTPSINVWDIHTVLPAYQPVHESPASASKLDELNMENDRPSAILTPLAHHVSTNPNLSYKRSSLLSSPIELEKNKERSQSVEYPVISQAQIPPPPSMSSPQSHQNLMRTLRSPKQQPLQQPRSRRTSDEKGPRNFTYHQVQSENPFFASSLVSANTVSRNSSSSNSVANRISDSDDARKIMMGIFSIFKRVTSYFILPSQKSTSDSAWVSKDFRNIIKPIFVAIMDSNDVLQSTAQSFMDVLGNYIADFSLGVDAKNLSEHYLLCTYTIALFSAALYDLKINSAKREVLLSVLVKFFKVKTKLMKLAGKSHLINEITEIEKTVFPLLAATSGSSLFISLHCNKGNSQKFLIQGYAELATSIKFYEKYVGGIDKTCIYNLNFINATAGGTYPSSGSVAFQRRLRNDILKNIRYPDSSLLDAMNVLYNKWFYFSSLTYLSHEELADFRSIAGILASMAGILFIIGGDDILLFKSLPYLLDLRNELNRKMDYFVKKQCDWLNNSDLLTRENSRDILSVELHPLSFKLMLAHLHTKIEQISALDLSQQKNQSAFLLLEQSIIILRTVLKRDDEERNMLVFSPELIEVIDLIIDVVENIDKTSIKYYKAVIQLSKMLRAVEHSETSLGLRNHFMLKNKWIKLVISWFNHSIVKEYDFVNLSKPHRKMNLKKRDLDFLYIDTSIESSRALSYLTENVPLIVAPTSSKEELKRSATVTFGNYFCILLKGLEKYTSSEESPVSVKHKINILTENIITSLTNLSNANVNASLQFSLPMGYSNNVSIRVAFLTVFVDIISNYPTQESQSDKNRMTGADQLIQLFIRHPKLLYYMSSICPASDVDALAVTLVNGFETRNAGFVAVTSLLKEEIKDATRCSEILRRNSCGTRALALYARQKGHQYLIDTLGPVLQEIIESGVFLDIEPSPSNEGKPQVDTFMHYLEKLVDSLENSVDLFPPELLIVCKTIYESVVEKFPEYALIAVGSFVFLRFIGPALVSPDYENIIDVSSSNNKRSFVALARIIQSMANGSNTFGKWPLLAPKSDLLEAYSKRIFDFLSALCLASNVPCIEVGEVDGLVPFDYNFLHKFVYEHDLDLRSKVANSINTQQQFELLKDTSLLVDNILGIMGQPIAEMENELPEWVKENMDSYPHIYEFMNRHSFRSFLENSSEEFAVQESMSSDGIPVVIVTFGKLSAERNNLELFVFKLLLIQARVWSNKYYLAFDCTEYGIRPSDFKKLSSKFFSLLPAESVTNCANVFYINVTELFMKGWIFILEMDNPFISEEVPFQFLNSNSDWETMQKLGLPPRNLEVSQNIRIAIHDIALYDETKDGFFPVTLKLGSKYFQVLQETPKIYHLNHLNTSLGVKLNNVYHLSEVSSITTSSLSAIENEFTVSFFDDSRLIFSSPKYLEIVKMFYYTQSKLETEYEVEGSSTCLTTEIQKKSRDRYDIICHLLLVIFVNLFNADNVVKNVSYNLLVAVQDAFDLDLGAKYCMSPEVYVPEDTTTFLSTVSKALAKSSPELTPHMWKYMLSGLRKKVIAHEYIPVTICCLSYWVPNVYKHVYLTDEEEGVERVSHIIRILIMLTVQEPDFKTVYLQHVWFGFSLDDRLTKIIVNEIINHALERDSEGRDWKRGAYLITGFSSAETGSQIVDKLLDMIRSFLPSLNLETSTHSWSEVTILSKLAGMVFFEAPLLAQMYLPQLLFIISLLIDVGPSELRFNLHQLLMNICHSLSINEALSPSNRENLNRVSGIFSRQKLNLVSSFNQDKTKLLPYSAAASFGSKFTTLQHFVTNLVTLMNSSSPSEGAHWKSRYKKLLVHSVCTSDSFLSARAMMILGILGEKQSTENMCKSLLSETMRIIGEPSLTDETLLLTIAHSFAYSKLVQGLDGNLPIVKQMFWFSTTVVTSKHPVLFEAGLTFMSNCLNKLYLNHFDNSSDVLPLPDILLEARSFAASYLDRLESFSKTKWNKENYVHILLAFIIRGLSIPAIKTVANSSLRSLFLHSYSDLEKDPSSVQHMSYMLILFLLYPSNQFCGILEEIGLVDTEMLYLDEEHAIPGVLSKWITSDSCDSNITLYQCALLFASSILDEPSKYRFALIMRYLLQTNPVCLYRFYLIVRKELRRISSLEENAATVSVAFDIVGLSVTHEEFNYMEDFGLKSSEYIDKRGLSIIKDVEVFKQNYEDIMIDFQADPRLIYENKKLTLMILSRMSCHI
ncbi:hypothetical protein KAFR_0G01460 [Kazachstania africana CBS 2517]|uniref:Ras-GAP domain-containing protein n=1 Tax=Kazachstania africana (strain ATCC 22294 / BCRC 22015 / CBS 2517 / CECT 1963 / NBRC 1671 / NRRL Y-8276) TaxID=1071382 RepID=H2AXT0_KAZAF|nr:hypothetical protein KAFR_0G01460 [Kazachstania africana CBS 2517]CCF59180.1 hypothetical protein KAFR_0G01460 [Kazachstania africana CBS 2517]